MRIVLRISAVLVVILLLALGGLAFWLPSLVQRPAVKARIVEAAKQSTGRTLEYQKLSVGVLPPRLLVEDPQLVAKGMPPIRARRIALRVALLPLLTRTLVVDSVVVEGADLPLERTANGVEVPGLRLGAGGASGQAQKPPAGGEGGKAQGGSGVQVAVRKVSLTGGRVQWVDRTLSPPAHLTLEDVDASAQGVSRDAPIPFSVSMRLASGGRLEAHGKASPSGVFDAKLAVKDLALAPLAPYLGRGTRADGTLGLEAQARGAKGRLDSLDASATLDAKAVGMGATRLQGSVALKAQLSGPFDALTGHFEADATRADVASGQAFHKAAGVPLQVSGRITALGPGRVALDDVALRAASLAGKGRVSVAKKTQVQLSAPPFDVAGLAKLLPGIGGQAPGGRIALDGVRVDMAPLQVFGDITLDGVTVPVGQGQASLQGKLQGTGDALAGKNLELKLAGQPFRVNVRVASIASRPDLQLQLQGTSVESGELMAALAGKRDLLQGPLTVDSRLGLPLAGGNPVRQVAGTVRFDISPGRLQGVSLLRSTFDQLGSVGEAALLAGRLKGGKTLQKFYGDRFEKLAGTLQIAGGVAKTNDLYLEYDNYRVDLRGSLGLADQKLDMTGRLTIYENVDAALSGAGETLAGGAPQAVRPVQRTIPLAHVGGTLSSPKVVITPATAASFAANYLTGSKQGRKLIEKLDKQLGPGGGQQVIDTLDAILGGAKQKSPQQ